MVEVKLARLSSVSLLCSFATLKVCSPSGSSESFCFVSFILFSRMFVKSENIVEQVEIIRGRSL